MVRHKKKEKFIPPIPKVDIITPDLPFPYRDRGVEEVNCAFVFNRVPARQRGQFMDELWRILKPGGKATIIVPYWSSMRAIADFSNEWPPICEMTFCYFKKSERDNAKVHPELKCDFEWTLGYTCGPEVSGRAPDVQSEWIKYRLNTAQDLHVILTKRIE